MRQHSTSAKSPERPVAADLANEPAVLYLASRLPALSETFVYHELLAVRAKGFRVLSASVYPPKTDTSDPNLQELIKEGTLVYSVKGLVSAMTEIAHHPWRSLRTLSTAIRDAIWTVDANLKSRVLLVPQAIAALGLAGSMRKRNVYHIHAHMANTPTTIAMYGACQLKIGFSFTGHANDLFVHRSLLPEKLKRAKFVSCISRWHRDFYRRFGHISDARLPVIRCGVTTGASAASMDDIPSQQNNGRALRILSVGRLVHKKGMDTLIAAIGGVDRNTPVFCEIVGDGPLRSDLETMIASRDLSDRVRLKGAIPNHEVLALLYRCDLFVLACRREPITGDQDGIPVALMEAMAAGRCVVTSNLAPVTELVIDGKTGICIPESDTGSLAKAIQLLAFDVNLRNQLAHNGRLHVSLEFDRDLNTDRLCEHFVASHPNRKIIADREFQ